MNITCFFVAFFWAVVRARMPSARSFIRIVLDTEDIRELSHLKQLETTGHFSICLTYQLYLFFFFSDARYGSARNAGRSGVLTGVTYSVNEKADPIDMSYISGLGDSVELPMRI
jgi:hypothetical protein